MKPVILGLSGPCLTGDERALLSEHQPLGVILFARNIETPAQVRALNAEIKAVLGPAAVLMVDQEGGRVARLKPPHWPALPPAASLRTKEAAYAHGRALGAMVKAEGFTMTAAPVLDLNIDGADAVIGDRAFTGPPELVAELGGALARGILDEGIDPVIKHIPGHGRAMCDSHLALPRVTVNDEADHLPFRTNRHLPWAMTAHILYEQWDRERPATLSPIVIREVIRGRIGFEGKIMSDDLAMKALSGTLSDLARQCLAAGCDVVLYCPGDMAGNREVLEAVG
ncbi:beta-N-acetylhexosaminidase [Acidocella sp.]|uniref:beta-N-acetylhexosaminidase n=1 Tax=Acidocella sp. TaxID=50710 RepID=UPI002625F0C7|nr:beta-N-acetylhexosaminidase [Acidocella sp.]